MPKKALQSRLAEASPPLGRQIRGTHWWCCIAECLPL